MDLYFTVTDYKLSKDFKDTYPNKSNDYLRLFIDFTTTDWDDLNKYIILKNNLNQAFSFDYDSTGILIPFDVLKGSRFYVSVYGVSDDVRVTTNVVTVYLKESNYTTEYSSIVDFEGDIIDNIRKHLTTLDTEFDDLDTTYAKHSEIQTILDDISNLDKVYSKITDLNDLRSDVEDLDKVYCTISDYNYLLERLSELSGIYASKSSVDNLQSELDDLDNQYANKYLVEGIKYKVDNLENVYVKLTSFNMLSEEVTDLKEKIIGIEEDMLL
jgi:hypothetical protein